MQGKNKGLEAMRGGAALVVIWCHAILYKVIHVPTFLALPGQYATEAVICFFVLSGLVITMSAPAGGEKGVGAYLRARARRIYPIYLLGLALALLAALVYGDKIDLMNYLANLFFLHSMTGFPAGTVSRNYALWSLANEVLYYLLYAVVLVFPRFALWWSAIALAAVAVSPWAPQDGALGYLVFMLGLSLPWLMGHWVARYRDVLPRFSIAQGLAFLAIGLALARASFGPSYYDPIRLSLFGMSVCHLLIALLRARQEISESLDAGGVRQFHISDSIGGVPNCPRAHSRKRAQNQFRAARCIVALLAVSLLWLTGHSHMSTKVVLTAVAMAAGMLPLPAQFSIPILPQALSAVGSISYGIYALHMPILYLTLLSPAYLPEVVRFVVFAVATVAVATAVEKAIHIPMLDRRRNMMALLGSQRPAPDRDEN